MNLIPGGEMDSNFDNPFYRGGPAAPLVWTLDVCLVDFHRRGHQREGAPRGSVSGRAVQAVWGTHTHVPTADAKVLPRGTGFLTDLYDRARPVRAGDAPGTGCQPFPGQAPHAL